MKRDEKAILYGGSNNVIDSTCPRCQGSLDKHGINVIRSGEKSRKLLFDNFLPTLNNYNKETLLDDNLREAYLRLASGPGGGVIATSMMGVAVATIGTQEKQYATLSGPGARVVLPFIKRGQLPTGLVIVGVVNALEDPDAMVDVRGKTFVPTSTAQGNNMDYPIGSCAAQKILNQIFRDARDAGKKVEAIDLSELFWRDYAAEKYSRAWSTGSIVPSCDTCKQVLPQMLCDRVDD
ncbi:hypothetical protein [Streptosporangium sp. NPDC004631]